MAILLSENSQSIRLSNELLLLLLLLLNKRQK